MTTLILFSLRISIDLHKPSHAVATQPGCCPLWYASASFAMLTSWDELSALPSCHAPINYSATPDRRTGKIVACDEIDWAVLGLVVHVLARVGCGQSRPSATSPRPTPATRQSLLHMAPEQLAIRTGRFFMVVVEGTRQ
jgi:hypothetical protein